MREGQDDEETDPSSKWPCCVPIMLAGAHCRPGDGPRDSRRYACVRPATLARVHPNADFCVRAAGRAVRWDGTIRPDESMRTLASLPAQRGSIMIIGCVGVQMGRRPRRRGALRTRAPTVVQSAALLAMAAFLAGRPVSAQGCSAGFHALTRVQALSASWYHTCAITKDAHGESSSLFCWGGNDRGQLITDEDWRGGEAINRYFPRYINLAILGSAVKVTALSVSRQSTCVMVAARASYTLYCWGRLQEELPPTLSTQGQDKAAIEIEDGLTPIEIRAGWRHVCVLARGNSTGVYCAGANTVGQLGLGLTGGERLPLSRVNFTKDAGQPTGIAVGDEHTCAMASGGRWPVYCWGRNDNKQCASDGDLKILSPKGVSLDNDAIEATAIAAGGRHTCVMTTGGKSPIYCWGQNNYGQLGIAASGQNPAPVPLSESGISPISLTLGLFNTCVMSADQQIHCVGWNTYGQLGLGGDSANGHSFALENRVSLAPGDNATAVAVGGAHMCAIVRGEELRCWGANGKGQLGRPRFDAAHADDLQSPCTCPTGQYMNLTKLSCQTCPQNASAHMGSDDVSNCGCNPGFTGPNGGDCTPCIGSYKSTSGSEPCTQCEAGTVSSTIAASSVSACSDCLADTYSSSNNTECKTCPPHSTSPPKSTNQADCKCHVSSLHKTKLIPCANFAMHRTNSSLPSA